MPRVKWRHRVENSLSGIQAVTEIVEARTTAVDVACHRERSMRRTSSDIAPSHPLYVNVSSGGMGVCRGSKGVYWRRLRDREKRARGTTDCARV